MTKTYLISEEVLRQLLDCMNDSEASGRHDEGSEILSKILASPSAEPVAWIDKDECVLHESERETPVATLERMGWEPLYRKDL